MPNGHLKLVANQREGRTPLSAYARATRCPVLTYRMLLPGLYGDEEGNWVMQVVSPYGATRSCARLLPLGCAATNTSYAATTTRYAATNTRYAATNTRNAATNTRYAATKTSYAATTRTSSGMSLPTDEETRVSVTVSDAECYRALTVTQKEKGGEKKSVRATRTPNGYAYNSQNVPTTMPRPVSEPTAKAAQGYLAATCQYVQQPYHT
eukprot:3574548-Rhodomonas_salina.1